jgi:hypothetical protein
MGVMMNEDWANGYDSAEALWAEKSWAIWRRLLDRVDAEAVLQGYLDIDTLRFGLKEFREFPTELARMQDILDQYIAWAVEKEKASEVYELMKMRHRPMEEE